MKQYDYDALMKSLELMPIERQILIVKAWTKVLKNLMQTAASQEKAE
jgi:hypothetical protein